MESDQKTKIETIIRQHHLDLSEALVHSTAKQILEMERDCLLILKQEGLLTTEVQRELDGISQRILFSWLQNGHSQLSESGVISVCRTHLGEDKLWLEKYRRFRELGKAIVLSVLTWQCEMRCTYCSIPKQSGREVSKAILDLSAELLLSAPQQRLEMRYFGGEPLLEWEKLKYSIESIWERQQTSTRCQNKDISFLITTNGMKLDRQKIEWMARYPISLRLR